ncbi:hypothetical protein [Luteimonas terricola]|uniref:DUF2798 domain-containing protein n=1 Tax=Luteimonas terricola TaxID=645597 RepID=A0ABQ2ELY7_9GAMM|nr:hypothetical protein [Luteimonas terricola]GGK15841.1 hypothetical protein GCM10011394_26300 [Luteimonas terricola]
MSRSTRRLLLRNALSTLIIVDLLALLALIANQWLVHDTAYAWGIATMLALPLYPLARRLSDQVLAMADHAAGIPDTGEQIPEAGQ